MSRVSMLVVGVTVIFCLVSLSQTAPAPQSCEMLLKPLEMKTVDPLIGKWSGIASSSSQAGARTTVKITVENIKAVISAGTHPNMIKDTIYMKTLGGGCSSYSINMTLEDNKLSWFFIVPASAVFLPTCPDCLTIYQTIDIDGKNYKSLDLFSQRRQLTPDEMFQFKTQVECLGLPSPYSITSEKEHCPDSTEISSGMEETVRQVMTIMETDVAKVLLGITDFIIEKAEEGGKDNGKVFLESLMNWIS
ncbi:hypothetical protein UPYG_G00048850 [Umbra pygmaea]|uniref:Apolipoprotein M n=1 Tax=Umbra pygmaea TaxID=75934 RepID=A0ABD0YD78_UMBPY